MVVAAVVVVWEGMFDVGLYGSGGDSEWWEEKKVRLVAI